MYNQEISKLILLRWGAFTAYCIVWLLGIYMIGANWFQPPVITILTIILFSNILLYQIPTNWDLNLIKRTILYSILTDVFLITVFLYFYGGYTNPFSGMYLVEVCLSGFLLTPAATWIIFSLVCISYGALYKYRIPIPIFEHGHHFEGFSVHLWGMLVSFVLTGGMVTFFLTKMRSALDSEHKKVIDLQADNFKRESIAKINTFISLNAHELGSPLSTISLIVEELQESRDKFTKEIKEQIDSLTEQTDKCSAILSKIRSRFFLSESKITFHEILECLSDRFSDLLDRLNFTMDPEIYNQSLETSIDSVSLGFSAFIDNAVKYSNSKIEIRFYKLIDQRICCEIMDEGPGVEAYSIISNDDMKTKSGLGVGALLAKEYFESLGADVLLEYTNKTSKIGATVKIYFPKLSL